MWLESIGHTPSSPQNDSGLNGASCSSVTDSGSPHLLPAFFGVKPICLIQNGAHLTPVPWQKEEVMEEGHSWKVCTPVHTHPTTQNSAT